MTCALVTGNWLSRTVPLGAIRCMQAPSKAGHHQHKKLDKSNLSATGVLQGSAPRASASTSLLIVAQQRMFACGCCKAGAQGKGGAKGRSQTAAVTTPDAASTLPSDSCESMAASGQIRSDAANCKQPSHQPAEDIFQDPAVLQAAVRKQPQQSHAAQPSGALHAGPQVHAYQRHGHDAPHPSHHHQHHQPLHPQLPLHVQQQQHPYLHPHPHPHPQALPQQQPVVALQPASLVQAVHFLNAYGFNLPLVWHAMGIPMTPATCTPADIWAAAQVARAPPELVHRALALPHQAAAADPAQASGPGAAAAAQPGQAPGAVSSTAGPISCAALEQRLTSLNLDERPAQQQQQQQQQGGLVVV